MLDPDEERNPFVLPTDEEVFRLRDEDRARKEAERVARRDLKVWQKTTSSAIAGRAGKIGKLLRDLGEDGGATGSGAGPSGTALSASGLAACAATQEAAAALVAKDRRQEKETMTDFIAKKREMFLVQMSLDTKREEIRKLEEKARLREEALQKSEQMLEEDAIRFDTFLKENDKKAHEAIKKADKETKLKADKVAEMKKLNQQIQAVQSDMSKHREALEDCVRYKSFLDALTPPAWFQQQRDIKRARQEARRQQRVARHLAEYEKKVAAAQLEEDRAKEEAAAKQGRVRKKGDKKNTPATGAGGAHSSTDANFPLPEDSEQLTSSGEDIPMHFEKPEQLLDMLQALEEQNLFLIQNSQETENTLEELRHGYAEVQRSTDAKTAALRRNVEALEKAIAVEDARAAQLRRRVAGAAGDAPRRQEELLKRLHAKVRDVYVRCGFDAGTGPSTLVMLSELEARLEDLLGAVAQMPDDYVARAEKDKEKRRRSKKRAEQQAEMERAQEERNRKAIERSLQAPKKRAGRPVMYRSRPVRQERREEKGDDDAVDEDEIRHLT